MMSQGGESSGCPLPTTEAPQASRRLSQNHAFSLPNFDEVTREELVIRLQEYSAYVYILESKFQQLAAETERAVPESISNGTEGNESLEAGREPLPPAEVVRPDTRMYVPDTQGMKVEHPSDLAGSYGASELATNLSAATPTFEWSSQHVVTTARMSVDEKLEVLFQVMQQCQADLEEQKGKNKQASHLIHSLQTQLSAAKIADKKKDEKMAKLKDEIATKDDQIKEHKQQLQLANKDPNQPLSLCPGIKRGRFIMSKAPILECSNCKRVFTSEEAVNNSICYHHPKHARELPNKMVAAVFPKEPSKLCYWPCCKQINTKIPPPCHHGTHAVRVV